MSLDKTILKEEAHIGEELLSDSKVSALDRKCFAVKQVVADGAMTLDEALEGYGVSLLDYEKYTGRYMVSEVVTMFPQGSAMAATASIAVIEELYIELVARYDVDAEGKVLVNHLRALSEKMHSARNQVGR